MAAAPRSLLAALPKVELHVHLDCCLSYEAASSLCPGLTRPGYERRFVAPPRCRDLADFLRVIDASLELLQDEAGLRLAVADLLAQLARDRVLYAEVRFAPLLHLRGGLDAERVVAVVAAETQRQAARHGVTCRLILCTLRHFSRDQGLQTARLAERFAAEGVAALDLAADEAGFPLAPHGEAFAHARACGLGLTAHAGEARGPESVRETLAFLAPQRLGHGVRSAEEPALVEELRRRRVHLEVCPSSNLQTGVYASIADHPIDRLYRLGVPLGINTDARTVTPTTLADEYELLQGAFNWGTEDFLACNRHALQAAFVDEATRLALGRRLESQHREAVAGARVC